MIVVIVKRISATEGVGSSTTSVTQALPLLSGQLQECKYYQFCCS